MAATLTANGVNFGDGTTQNSAGSWSISGNGYAKLPSGLVIQWGQITTNVSTDTSLTFPTSFPSACTGFAGSCNLSTGQSYVMMKTSPSKTGTTVRWERPSGSGSPSTIYWIATGY